MLLTKGGYIHGWNAQVAVDGTAQVILVHGTANDRGSLYEEITAPYARHQRPRSAVGLLALSRRTLGDAARGFADSGDLSEPSLGCLSSYRLPAQPDPELSGQAAGRVRRT